MHKSDWCGFQYDIVFIAQQKHNTEFFNKEKKLSAFFLLLRNEKYCTHC